jgi:hypothetical protein
MVSRSRVSIAASGKSLQGAYKLLAAQPWKTQIKDEQAVYHQQEDVVKHPSFGVHPVIDLASTARGQAHFSALEGPKNQPVPGL